MTIFQFSLLNTGALLTAIGGIFLKKLSLGLSGERLSFLMIINIIQNSYFWIGAFCFIFPVLLWAYLLQYIELTQLQPMLAVVYLYTLLLSVFFLGEVPSFQRCFGISIIAMGVFIVGKS